MNNNIIKNKQYKNNSCTACCIVQQFHNKDRSHKICGWSGFSKESKDSFDDKAKKPIMYNFRAGIFKEFRTICIVEMQPKGKGTG